MLKIIAKRKSITVEIACRDLLVLTGLFIASGGQFAPVDAGASLSPQAYMPDEPSSSDSDSRPRRQYRAAPRRNAPPHSFTAPPPAPDTQQQEVPELVPEPVPAAPGSAPGAAAPCSRALPEPGWSSYRMPPGPVSPRPEPALQVLKVDGQAGRACRLFLLPRR